MPSSPFDVSCLAAALPSRTEHRPSSGNRSSVRRGARWHRTASVLALAAVALATSAVMQQAVAAPGTPGATGTLPQAGPITGGRGGDGATGDFMTPPGSGDVGGAGMVATGATGANTAAITGGDGGNGGAVGVGAFNGGNGGAGGSGLDFSGSDSVTNAGGPSSKEATEAAEAVPL